MPSPVISQNLVGRRHLGEEKGHVFLSEEIHQGLAKGE
jgi:hypothetical protein